MKSVSGINYCYLLFFFFLFINAFLTSFSFCAQLKKSLISIAKDFFAPSRACYNFPVTEDNRKLVWLTALSHPDLLSTKYKKVLSGKNKDISNMAPVVQNSLRESEEILQEIAKNELKPEYDKEIIKDLGRTSLHNRNFYKNLSIRETTEKLKNLLTNIAKYEDIGYTQGMNFIGAFLLDHMNENEAFFAFTKLMTKPNINLKSMFKRVENVQKVEMYILLNLLKKHVSKVEGFLKKHNFSFDEVLVQISVFISPFVKLFVTELPTVTTEAIWDCLMRHGKKVIYAAFIALCKKYEIVFSNTEENMPFNVVYKEFSKFRAEETDSLMKTMRKFMRSLSDSTIEDLRNDAFKYIS